MNIEGIKFEQICEECILDVSSTSIVYEIEYFTKYKKHSQTHFGKKLEFFRKAYVESLAVNGNILDYGCGYGKIVTEDKHDRWRGYDVNIYSKKNLKNKFDASFEIYKNITMFDVLEHIKKPISFLQKISIGCRLFISIPICNWTDDITKWKHWKPNEHFLYASPIGFETMMKNCNFEIIDANKIETSIGREDIYTYCFQKTQADI